MDLFRFFSNRKSILAVVLLLGAGLVFASQVWANQAKESQQAPALSGTMQARQTRLAAEVMARVTAVHVEKGDAVKAGDSLVVLDDSHLRTTLDEAESAVRAAQASLDQVMEQARPGAVSLAEAGKGQAEADLAAARRALEDADRALASPQDLLAQVHTWEARVQAARGEVGQAEASLASVNSQVEQAERDQSMAGKSKLAALQKQQEGARATLQAAQENLAGSQRVLGMYRELVKNPMELEAARHAAAAQVKVTEAGLQAARLDLQIVRRPPQPEAVALAEARLAAAKAQLQLVQAQLKRYILTSPIDGTVTDKSIEVGETVQPARTVLNIADTRELEMTVFVPIRYLAAAHVGQAVSIRVPSLSGRSFPGRVIYVAPEAEFKPANVYNSQDRSEMVFALKVAVDNSDGRLKAGLPADVTWQ